MLKKLLTFINRLRNQLAARKASPLPVGMTEFHAWAEEIIGMTGQFADLESMKYALASMIIHGDSKRGSIPKAEFASMLRKAAANQVASQFFQDVKTRQAEEQAKAAAAPESGTDEQKQV